MPNRTGQQSNGVKSPPTPASQLSDLKRQISNLKTSLNASSSNATSNRLVSSASVSANLQQHINTTLGDFLEPIAETREEQQSLALSKTSKSFSNTNDLNRYLQQSDFASGNHGYDDQSKLTLEVS